MTASIGSQVRLYIDTSQRVRIGDFIQTPTGRTYLIDHVRTQQRGRHAGTRQHLRVTVVPPALAEGGRVIPIRWYRR